MWTNFNVIYLTFQVTMSSVVESQGHGEHTPDSSVTTDDTRLGMEDIHIQVCTLYKSIHFNTITGTFQNAATSCLWFYQVITSILFNRFHINWLVYNHSYTKLPVVSQLTISYEVILSFACDNLIRRFFQ